jgi:hypothetical protein
LVVIGRGELIQMFDAHMKKILRIAIITGIVLGGLFLLAVGIQLWRASGIKLPDSAPQLTLSLFIVAILVLVVTLGMAIVLYCCSGTSDRQPDAACVSRLAALDKWERKILLVLVVLGAVAVGGTFVWTGLGIRLEDGGPELKLPLIVIVGVVVLC